MGLGLLYINIKAQKSVYCDTVTQPLMLGVYSRVKLYDVSLYTGGWCQRNN